MLTAGQHKGTYLILAALTAWFCLRMCSGHAHCCISAADASGQAFGVSNRNWIGLAFLALAAQAYSLVNYYGMNHLDNWPNDLCCREQMQEPMLAGLAAVMLGACLSGQSQVLFCD